MWSSSCSHPLYSAPRFTTHAARPPSLPAHHQPASPIHRRCPSCRPTLQSQVSASPPITPPSTSGGNGERRAAARGPAKRIALHSPQQPRCLLPQAPRLTLHKIAGSVILVDRRTTATLSHHRQCQPRHLSVREFILAPWPARPPSIQPLRFSFVQTFARFLVIVCDFCVLLLWVAQSV